MARILIADPIAESAVEEIKGAGHEVVTRNKEKDGPLQEQLQGFDCVVIRSATTISEDILKAVDSLKLVVRAGVGLDNVDLDAAKRYDVKVMNTPEAPTVSVAEMVIAFMFALGRRITSADSSMKEERWEKKQLKGTEVWKKTLGIIGFGRIGYEVARRARALEMNVLAYDVVNIDEHCKKIGAQSCDLEEVIKSADYITLHVPLIPQTEGMIGEKELRMMKETAYLINTARGGVVDEKALFKALEEGWIAGAGLDVYENEPPEDWTLVKHPKVIATPHVSSSTKEAQERVGELTVQKILAAFE
ncbi:MAG: hypothetical protein BAJATHORv1_20555 [Candidatus Thorarchaeota archaeon]|nr:MAG: hypothetical protein BAJATHORv1_20555 [Candidatus Thorarchaeota archaeon]